jgi:hypothetical protein
MAKISSKENRLFAILNQDINDNSRLLFKIHETFFLRSVTVIKVFFGRFFRGGGNLDMENILVLL